MTVAAPAAQADTPVFAAYSFVEARGGVECYRLRANGLRVLLMPQGFADAALLMLTYEVGSRNEPATLAGASHMLEHLMFRGSARYNRRDRTSIFDHLLPLGATVNATTWLDRTSYYSLLPSAQLPLALQIEADRMQHVLLDAADLEAERVVVLNEYDYVARDLIERLHQAVWAAMFPAHRYGLPVIGTRAAIQGYDADALREYHRAHYRPERLTITVLGDFPKDETLAAIDASFGGIGAAPPVASAAQLPHGTEPRSERVALTLPGAPPTLQLAFRSPPAADPDVDALELLGALLTGDADAPLTRTLVAGGLAHSVWPTVSRLHDEGLFVLQANLADDVAPVRVEQALRAGLSAAVIDGLGAAALERAKTRACGQVLSRRGEPVAIGLQLSDAIGAGDWRYYIDAVERLQRVTLEQLRRVAKTYLLDRAGVVGTLLPA